MKRLGEEYGVLAHDVMPAALASRWLSESDSTAGGDGDGDGDGSTVALQWPSEDGNESSKRTPFFLVAPPPPPTQVEDGACVTLLWGLTHSVNAAVARLAALRSSRLVVSVNVGKLVLGRLEQQVGESHGEAQVSKVAVARALFDYESTPCGKDLSLTACWFCARGTYRPCSWIGCSGNLRAYCS